MNLHIRVATTFIVAATSPLPVFPKTETGMMTRKEYLKLRNPQDNHHPSSAYDVAVGSFNHTMYGISSIQLKGVDWSLLRNGQYQDRYIIRREGTPVAVLFKDTLIYSSRVNRNEIPLFFPDGRDDIILRPTKFKQVKYVDEAVALVSAVAAHNLSKYPTVLQRLLIRGEAFQVRTSAPPEKTLVVLNDKMEIVAMASDEWGATLLQVAQEYRRRGLGQIIGKFWYDQNPEYESGGYTNSGQENAVRLWEARVREFLENGWYSELVRKGQMTMARVKEIVKDLGGRQKPLQESKPDQKGETLVYAQTPTFVVYNSNFLEDPDDKYIHGYGFFRDASPGTFLYTIDYDPAYRKLVTTVALQMARDDQSPLFVGSSHGDLLELEGIPDIQRDGDYVMLDQDKLPLRTMGALEKKRRVRSDPFQEKEALLLEMAESKWN